MKNEKLISTFAEVDGTVRYALYRQSDNSYTLETTFYLPSGRVEVVREDYSDLEWRLLAEAVTGSYTQQPWQQLN